MKTFIRGDYAGKILVHYKTGYPQYYWAPRLTNCQWFSPVYQCDELNLLPRDWVVTYAVPFFGKDQFCNGLEKFFVLMFD
jgi:hypothetical protein